MIFKTSFITKKELKLARVSDTEEFVQFRLDQSYTPYRNSTISSFLYWLNAKTVEFFGYKMLINRWFPSFSRGESILLFSVGYLSGPQNYTILIMKNAKVITQSLVQMLKHTVYSLGVIIATTIFTSPIRRVTCGGCHFVSDRSSYYYYYYLIMTRLIT